MRPSQKRRLEKLSHRRHPEQNGSDQLTLERLAQEAIEIKQPIHLILDQKGLCRLLWIGALDSSQKLLEHIPGSARRKIKDGRLISCQIKHQTKNDNNHEENNKI